MDVAAAEDGAVPLIDNQEDASQPGSPPAKSSLRLTSLSTDGADGAALLVDPRSINQAEAHAHGPIIDEEADRLDTRFLGGKTIGLFGSIALTVNNVSGPGMLQISKVFQEAGWLAPCLAFVLVCVVSSFAVTLLADTIARLPGNDAQFNKRVEFSDPFRTLFGPRLFLLSHLLYYLCLYAQNIASIVATAQVMDAALVDVAGRTWALQLYPGAPRCVHWRREFCRDGPGDDDCQPFEDTPDHPYGGIVSVGYAATFATLMPFGLLNLDENIGQQLASFWVLCATCVLFSAVFLARGLEARRVPAVGDEFGNVLGVIIFNFAFCVTVPSWLNEKRPHVRVNRTIWSSTIASTVGYILFGLLGALAYDNVDDNLLNTLANSNSVAERVSAYVFAWAIIGLGIPIFCVIARYNLIVGGLASPGVATWWGCFVPWLSAWTIYQGDVAQAAINLSGLFVNSIIDFTLPILLTIASLGVPLTLGARAVLKHLRHADEPLVSAIQPVPQWLGGDRRLVSLSFGILFALMPPLLLSIVLSFCPSVSR